MGELGRLARGYGEVMFGEDFDAPVPGNAQERQDAKNEALGLPLDEARTLTAAWGYEQLRQTRRVRRK